MRPEVGGVDEAGNAIDVRDPLADHLREVSQADDPVAALLGVDAVFGTELPKDQRFRDAVGVAYANLKAHGARAAVHHYVSGGA